MPRIRTIKPEFFLDEDIADLKPLARLLYVGLWCLADREGRLEDKPRRIKAQVFPYSEVDIDVLLKELEAKPFIARYKVEDKPYIWVIHFLKHQRPHKTEKDSELPAFNGSLTFKYTLSHGEKSLEGKGKEGKGRDSCPSDSPLLEAFQKFWSAYPRKEGKNAALTAWGAKNPPLDKCLRTLTLLCGTEQWKREGGRFIPLPAKWIEQGRWEDVPEGYEEFTCPACNYTGNIRKGFRGSAVCPECQTKTPMTQGEA